MLARLAPVNWTWPTFARAGEDNNKGVFYHAVRPSVRPSNGPPLCTYATGEPAGQPSFSTYTYLPVSASRERASERLRAFQSVPPSVRPHASSQTDKKQWLGRADGGRKDKGN